tara:strand:+ start:166 stop:387 length:222 start_codon:yes stop_codon:yes gene_type:complete
MKKIAFLGIIISFLMTPLSALEKQDCSGLKKLSKAFVACKSSNLKTGLANKKIGNNAFKGNTKKYPKYVKPKK